MKTIKVRLPDDLLESLEEKEKEYSTPKSKLVEIALKNFLHHLDYAEYVRSHTKAGKDKSVMEIAEEGMVEYLNQIA